MSVKSASQDLQVAPILEDEQVVDTASRLLYSSIVLGDDFFQMGGTPY